MRHAAREWVLTGFLLGALIAQTPAHADDYSRPQWWPSPWGAEDQRGAMNLLTPAKVLEATALIKSGQIYDLGRVFEEEMPLFNLTPSTRKFTLSIPGAPSWGPMGENRLAWNEDYISGHLTQDGTQMDSLAHMATVRGKNGDMNEVRYYNGLSQTEIGTGRGFIKLGAENMLPVFTRGILIDLAGLKGRMLEKGEAITVADLKAALKREGLKPESIRPGDALLYNTGWGTLWKTDKDKFTSGTPGLDNAAGDWVIKKKVLLVGTDNWAVEQFPNPDPNVVAPNHQKFIVENGMYIIENMDFTKLIDAKVYEFAFVVGSLPIKGATGSPVRPFAIR